MSTYARFMPAAAPLIPDALPRLGAAPQVLAEFRALTRRLLAHADTLPAPEQAGRSRAAESRASFGPRPAPIHRTARLPLSPPGTASHSRVAGVPAAASAPGGSRFGPFPRGGAVAAAPREELRLRSSDDIAEALGFRRVAGTGDATLLVRELRTAVPAALDWTRALQPNRLPSVADPMARPGRPRGTLLLDIETAGLANAPILLVGCARVVGQRLVLRQYLATDYPSEDALLRAVARELARSARVVTFNGASFDIPALRDRSVLWGLAALATPTHVDLLPHARRAWRGVVANCRLGTLETVMLGRVRRQDMPSREVPEAFHRFARTGDPGVVAPIVRHNAFDVISMAGLAVALGVPV